MRYFKCILEYDGAEYSGWQRQENTPMTIQEKVESALAEIAKKPVCVLASSRTDAGVHAYGQVIGFHMDSSIPTERLPIAMNSLLPGEIRVKHAEEVDMNFHPRFQTIGKTYHYMIDNGQIQSVFRRRYAYHVPYSLDVEEMRKSSQHLVGKHDFSAFRAVGCSAKSPVRTIKNIQIFKENDLLRLEYEGDGFLYNMVRILTGTLIYAGLRKFSSEDIHRILTECDRTKAGPTAPAHGLYLVKVFY